MLRRNINYLRTPELGRHTETHTSHKELWVEVPAITAFIQFLGVMSDEHREKESHRSNQRD